MTMKIKKSQTPKHMKNARFTQTYRYSPLYYFSHQSSSDSKSQTSVISSSSQSKDSNVNIRIHPVSDNQHIVDLYDNISNNGDITVIEDSDLQPLALYVRESKQRATLQKNYDQADNLNDLLSSIKGEISSRSRNMSDQLNNQRTNYESEDVKNMNEEMQNIHEQELQEFDNNTNNLIDDTIRNQQCEKNSFEYDWENMKPIKYRKPSVKLLQMKEIEKSAIIAGDVSKARQMHTDIEKQTKKEANEQIQRFNEDYVRMKNRLIVKQQQEMERIKQNREELRQIIVTKQELDKEVCEKRMNVLNNKETTKQIKAAASEPGTDVYGCSLFHIMQETQFGIDPLLPELPQNKSKTGPNINSNNKNKNNYHSRPNSTTSPKRCASVQIGRFKWTLSTSNDPKYRTVTNDSKQKKKDGSKYVKKPQLNNKIDYLSLQSSPKKNKVISKNQSLNSRYENSKQDNTLKEEKKESFLKQKNNNSCINENNDILIDQKIDKQEIKHSSSDINEVEFSHDEVKEGDVKTNNENEYKEKDNPQKLDELFGSNSKLIFTNES